MQDESGSSGRGVLDRAAEDGADPAPADQPWRNRLRSMTGDALRPAPALSELSVDRLRAICLSSDSLVGQRMAVSFGIEFHDSFMDGAVEVIRAGEGVMSEMMPLQVAPENLDVVQLRLASLGIPA
jgi:hypothetical protein